MRGFADEISRTFFRASSGSSIFLDARGRGRNQFSLRVGEVEQFVIFLVDLFGHLVYCLRLDDLKLRA